MPIGIGIGIIVAAALTAYIVWTAVYSSQQATWPSEQRDTAAETETRETPAITPSRFLEIIAEHAPAMQAVFEPEIDPTAIARFTDALKTGVLTADTVVRREQNGPITINGLAIALSTLVKTETNDAFLHGIEVISGRYSFGMNLLEVVAVDLEMLSIHAEFQRIGESDSKTETERISGYSLYVIAYAFGYAEKETVKAIPKQAEKSVKKDAVIPEGSVEIGKIQTDGKIKIYYRTPTGKIISIEGES